MTEYVKLFVNKRAENAQEEKKVEKKRGGTDKLCKKAMEGEGMRKKTINPQKMLKEFDLPARVSRYCKDIRHNPEIPLSNILD